MVPSCACRVVACRLSWVFETAAAAVLLPLLLLPPCCRQPTRAPPALHSVPWQGGWTTLWRGTQPTVIRLGLGAGLHFLILVRAC